MVITCLLYYTPSSWAFNDLKDDVVVAGTTSEPLDSARHGVGTGKDRLSSAQPPCEGLVPRTWSFPGPPTGISGRFCCKVSMIWLSSNATGSDSSRRSSGTGAIGRSPDSFRCDSSQPESPSQSREDWAHCQSWGGQKKILLGYTSLKIMMGYFLKSKISWYTS